MKALMASEPVIAQPLPTGVFRIEVDASGFALGGVLSQHHPDGKWPFSIRMVLGQDTSKGEPRGVNFYAKNTCR